MLDVPMITARTCPPEATPLVPRVFPRLDAPIDCDSTVWLNALIEIVSETPLVLPERVMLLPPANTTLPATVPVSPEVLPPEIPAENCVPVWAFTENWYWFPVVERIVIAPSSDNDTVPLVYVV